jgi:hypothetical protein
MKQYEPACPAMTEVTLDRLTALPRSSVPDRVTHVDYSDADSAKPQETDLLRNLARFFKSAHCLDD